MKKFRTLVIAFGTKIGVPSILIMLVLTSCKTNISDSTLLSSLGKDIIMLPAKNIISANLIDDSVTMTAYRLLGNPSEILIIEVAESINIKDNSGKEVIYSITHIHDQSEEGIRKGKAIEIFTRKVQGGFVIAAAKRITCSIGNGL